LESALKPTQPQSILDKESIPRNVENASYSENSFALLDLRVNYKTEAVRFLIVSKAFGILKDKDVGVFVGSC
jgi:hypothetical protein